MKILIVEPNIDILNTIVSVLSNSLSIKKIYTSVTDAETIEKIKDVKPSFIFLDKNNMSLNLSFLLGYIEKIIPKVKCIVFYKPVMSDKNIYINKLQKKLKKETNLDIDIISEIEYLMNYFGLSNKYKLKS